MCIAIEQFRYDAFSFTVFVLLLLGESHSKGNLASLRLRFVSKIGLKLFFVFVSLHLCLL